MSKASEAQRPIITEYREPSLFLRDMIVFRKKSERSFSVLAATRSLRRISPTLITLIIAGKRKITMDRVEELARLMKLSASEKFIFKNWIEARDGDGTFRELPDQSRALKSRKQVSTNLLNDWINVYIKDYFQISKIQKSPELIYEQFGFFASRARIDKAIRRLLRDGHLRQTLDGKIVTDTPLSIADPMVPSKKIRQFHKGALSVARRALEIFPPTDRYANTLIVQLNEKKYSELIEMTQEFAEKLKDFASTTTNEGQRLYQLILNLSPVGGKPK